ncbi:P-loop containing nucleoside triphosphate hydrolase protein, partial [Athelia psychrophila]
LDAPTNVVIFGETGVGKSSLINMIAGREIANVANAARGCTFQSTSYDMNVGARTFRLWDTAGMNENENGSVAAKDAIINLYKLLDGLQSGVGLFVYCMRGRIKETTVKNYELFYEGFCQMEVPIVIIINALELEEPDMNSWWSRNEPAFSRQGMLFDGHACVTATKGRCKNGVHMFAAEYEESQTVARNLIRES